MRHIEPWTHVDRKRELLQKQSYVRQSKLSLLPNENNAENTMPLRPDKYHSVRLYWLQIVRDVKWNEMHPYCLLF